MSAEAEGEKVPVLLLLLLGLPLYELSLALTDCLNFASDDDNTGG